MVIHTRANGKISHALAQNESIQELFINDLCRNAFEEALRKIEPNKDMFSMKKYFNPKTCEYVIDVDCEFTIDIVKKE